MCSRREGTHSSSPPSQTRKEVDSPAFPAGTQQSSGPTPNMLLALGGAQNLSKRRVPRWLPNPDMAKNSVSPPTTDPYPQEPQGGMKEKPPFPPAPLGTSRGPHTRLPTDLFSPLHFALPWFGEERWNEAGTSREEPAASPSGENGGEWGCAGLKVGGL